MAVGDLDGDGNLDLATALQFGPIGDTVAVLFGRGDGTLGDMVSYDGDFEPFSPNVSVTASPSGMTVSGPGR